MLKFLKRLKEPSSQAGIASAIALVGVFGVPATISDAVVQIVGGIAALAAVMLPENK